MTDTILQSEIKSNGMELGIYSFGELIPDMQTGEVKNARERVQEILAAVKLADELGLDVFGAGEHHRLDMTISAPAVFLAAVAQVTKRLRLASAVTVLSTSDPVVVFEEFATLDLLSDGRAEIIAGRGAFIESFPLFGFNLRDYDALFSEKIELLLQLTKSERVTWQGVFRPALNDSPISPRPLQNPLPVWIGVGGTPESAVRAGKFGTPMALAIIGGAPAQFKPLVELYRRAGLEAGHPLDQLKVSVNSHFHVQKDSQKARDEFYPYYANYFAHGSKGRWREIHISPADYAQLASPRGALFVGSPQQIIDKIMHEYELFHHQRFMAQIDIGRLPYSKVAEGIELFAMEVAPVVRRETAKG